MDGMLKFIISKVNLIIFNILWKVEMKRVLNSCIKKKLGIDISGLSVTNKISSCNNILFEFLDIILFESYPEFPNMHTSGSKTKLKGKGKNITFFACTLS